MLFSTVGQGALFIWMMAAGMAMGAWYAAAALLRRCIRAGLWLSLACDLLFGAGCAAIFVLFSFAGNYGRPRLYDAIAALLGFALFHFALRGPLERMGACMRRICARPAKSRLLRRIFK